jgi:hypothetical protein
LREILKLVDDHDVMNRSGERTFDGANGAKEVGRKICQLNKIQMNMPKSVFDDLMINITGVYKLLLDEISSVLGVFGVEEELYFGFNVLESVKNELNKPQVLHTDATYGNKTCKSCILVVVATADNTEFCVLEGTHVFESLDDLSSAHIVELPTIVTMMKGEKLYMRLSLIHCGWTCALDKSISRDNKRLLFVINFRGNKRRDFGGNMIPEKCVEGFLGNYNNTSIKYQARLKQLTGLITNCKLKGDSTKDEEVQKWLFKKLFKRK